MGVQCPVSSVQCLVSRVQGPGLDEAYSMSRVSRIAVLAFTILFAGCGVLGRTEYQPLTLREMPWLAGERAVYRITDIDGNYAGTATYTLGQSSAEQWTFVRETLAQGTTEVVAVEMGVADLRPVQSMLIRTSANGRQRAASTYTRGQVDIELESEQNIVTYERQNVPTDARDQRTLLLLARALPLEQGYATRVNSFYPIRGQMERVTIVVVGEEEVSVPLGRFETWRVDLANPRHKTAAWYSKSAPHTLVKYVDGETGGTYELTEFGDGG